MNDILLSFGTLAWLGNIQATSLSLLVILYALLLWLSYALLYDYKSRSSKTAFSAVVLAHILMVVIAFGGSYNGLIGYGLFLLAVSAMSLLAWIISFFSKELNRGIRFTLGYVVLGVGLPGLISWVFVSMIACYIT